MPRWSRCSPCPPMTTSRAAFQIYGSRKMNRDGTATLAGVRFQIPDEMCHSHQVNLRYIRWDRSCVVLIDPQIYGTTLAVLYQLDEQCKRWRRELISCREQSAKRPIPSVQRGGRSVMRYGISGARLVRAWWPGPEPRLNCRFKNGWSRHVRAPPARTRSGRRRHPMGPRRRCRQRSCMG